jgi:peptidoglycan/xylan/chitin deacetylase (PgdA/CDA1 family)
MEEIMLDLNVSVEEIAKELWLTNFHIRKLNKEDHNIGMHSYDHPFTLSALSLEKQKEQYKKNARHIMRICKKEITAMSHPLNSYNDDTLGILNEMKIKCGFRSNMSPPSRKKINPNSLEIAREDITNILKLMSK